MLLLKRLFNKSKIHFPVTGTSWYDCAPLDMAQSLPEENHSKVTAFYPENAF